jgi:hypothetical protein
MDYSSHPHHPLPGPAWWRALGGSDGPTGIAHLVDTGRVDVNPAARWTGRYRHFSVGYGMASWMLVKSRIMYVELKSGHRDDGPAWIGRVTFSKTGRTVYYRGKSLRRASGPSVANHIDMETGEEYWVSGVKRNREDRHWAGHGPGPCRRRRL